MFIYNFKDADKVAGSTTKAGKATVDIDTSALTLERSTCELYTLPLRYAHASYVGHMLAIHWA